MALPAEYNTGTVTGTYVMIDGSNAQGTVTFTPRVNRILVSAAETVILPKTITATLVDGAFSVTLPATNDADVSPSNFTYRVVENITGGGGSTYDINVLTGETLDLSTILSGSISSGGSTIIKGEKGDPGDITEGVMDAAIAAAITSKEDVGVAAGLVSAIPSDGSTATPSLRTLGTGSTQAAQGSALATLTTTVAGKEDIGVAASLIAAEDELGDGESTKLDTSVSGFVSINHKLLAFNSKTSALTSTTSETSLLNAALALPTTWTVDTRYINMRITGVHVNNTGSSNGVTIKVKSGATAIWTFAFTGLSSSASERVFFIDITARVVEFIPGTCLLVGAARGAIGSTGGGATAIDLVMPTATLTFAPGASLSLEVTGQHSSSSSSQATLMAISSHVALAVI